MSDPISDVLDMRTCDDDAVCVMIKSGGTVQISNNGTGEQLLNMHLGAMIAILNKVCKDFEESENRPVARELLERLLDDVVNEVMKVWKLN